MDMQNSMDIKNITAQSKYGATDTQVDEKKPLVGLLPDSQLIYESDFGSKVYAVKAKNGTFQNVIFQVCDNTGAVSEPIVKTPSQLLGKSGFQFVYNLVGDFDKADLDGIKKGYREKESKLKSLTCIDKCSFIQVYKDLCTVEEESALITIDRTDNGDYLNIEVHRFKELVADLDWGWRPLDIQRRLRDLGWLRINKGRPYDFKKIDGDGNDYRTISIRLGMDGEK